MKKHLCWLCLAALLLTVSAAALTESPIGVNGELGNYRFALTGVRFDGAAYGGTETVVLSFDFTNGSEFTISGNPLIIRAYQGDAELYDLRSMFDEYPEIPAGGDMPFEVPFRVDNEWSDVRYTVEVYNHEEHGQLEYTLPYGDIGGGCTPLSIETYTLGADVLPTIPAVVGQRECIMSGASSWGSQEYTYKSAAVRDDLSAYIDVLCTEYGFDAAYDALMTEPGSGELTAASKESGKTLQILLDWTEDTYHIQIAQIEPAAAPVPAPAGPDPDIIARGRALMDDGQYEEASSLFDEALFEHPEIAAYHGGCGEALAGLGRYEAAWAALDTAISIDPTNWEYHNDLGAVFNLMGMPGDAIVVLETAITLNPTTDLAHWNLAGVQLELGEPVEAAFTCLKGLAIFPESANLWFLGGEAQFAQGEYQEAFGAYDQAIAYGYKIENIENYQAAKEHATGPAALFDDDVSLFTCAAYGNRSDCVMIGGFIISRGYSEETQRYCLISQGPDGARTALTDTLPAAIIPAGDSFIYYGKDAQGRFGWVIRKPGNGPARLDLGLYDEVFYADMDAIWYYTIIGEEISIRTLSRKDGAHKGIARTTGHVVALMEDSGPLIVNFYKNLVQQRVDGKIAPLYQPDEPLLSVSSIGRTIWVEREREFGLWAEGGPSWWLPGNIVSMTGTTDQFVLLLSYPGSSTYDVVAFNDIYGAYARVGEVPATPDAFVEIQPGRSLTVWSPIQSLLFDMPPANEWIPYGYYDAEGARADMLEGGC